MNNELSTQSKYPAAAVPESSSGFREIRLTGSSMSDEAQGVESGHYYIVGYRDAENEDLGESLDCVILRQSIKARGKWNDDDLQNKHYEYDSSEFLSFNDFVVLYDQSTFPSQIKAALPYSHKNPELPSIGGKGDNAMKDALGLRIQYVLYVLYNGETFRMYMGSTSYTGADSNDKPIGFNNPQEGSFLAFLHTLEGVPSFGVRTTLTGRQHSKKIMLKLFTKSGDTDGIDVDSALEELYESLNQSHWNTFGKVYEATDLSKLDDWSQKIVKAIHKYSFDSILRGTAKEELVIDTESIPQIVDNSFPPSEEMIAEHGKKKASVSFAE